jgi:peptide/nickel transport system substrate-binding protein
VQQAPVAVPAAQGAVQADAFTLDDLEALSGRPDVVSSLHPSLGLASLEFDVRSPVTGTVAVRQALAHLVDRTGLRDAVLGSVDPSIPINDDHLAVASQVSYTASSAAGEYAQQDPDAAARLLRTAGYERDAGGTWVCPGGIPLTVRLAVEGGQPWLVSAAFGIVAELRSAGVVLVPSVVDGPAGLRAASAAGAYDLALVVRPSSPFQSVTQAWYAPPPPHAGPADQQDWSRFDDPEVEQLFAKAATILNPVTGGSVYAQIDDQLWDQMVALPLFGLPGVEANGVRLSGVAYNPTEDGLLWNAGQWSRLAAAPASKRG